jgi:hypothetical protein
MGETAGMNKLTQSEQLRQYNRWRRGDDTIEQPNPTELGKLLDDIAYQLGVLEREKLSCDIERLKELCEEAQSLIMESAPGENCAYTDWEKERREWIKGCRLRLSQNQRPD